MTPRQIALDVAQAAATRIGEEIRNERTWKRQHPYVSYRYHTAMAASLPRWRLLARRFHKGEARRYAAHWQASNDAPKCRKAEALAQ